MQMTYEQAMRPGMLLAFANRRGSGYMMRSEKRTGSYGSGSNRRPPKRRAGFFYIFLTLLLCIILWPVGMVMLWRRKVRLQAGTKLLISLLTLCLSVFLIVFGLTVPVDNPEFTAFQDRANDWLDQAAADIAKAGDAAYKKGTETWQIMSDFGEAGANYAMAQAADLLDRGVEIAGEARTGIEGLFHREGEPVPADAPEITDTPEITDAPEVVTEAPETTDAPAITDAPTPEAPDGIPDEDEGGDGGMDIRLPEQAPDAQAAQPLAAGTLHADGSFTPAEVSAPESVAPVEESEAPIEETPESETWTAVEDVTEAPTEEPTEAPAEEPTEAPTEEPTEAPTEEPTEAPAEEPTEAPAEEPTEAPAEEPTEDPVKALVEPTPGIAEEATEAPAEEPTEAPAEETAEPLDGDGVMVLVEPTPEPEPEAPAETETPSEPEAPVETEAPVAVIQVKPAGQATVYYFENGGKGFHATSSRHNLNNIPAHTLAEAFAAGKRPCKDCGMPEESILSEENVAWVDEDNLIHTSDECAAFSGAWRLVPLAQAVEAGYAACPNCGADAYVESVFPSPTATPEPEVVTPSIPLKPADEIAVYYYDSSRSYHVAPNCKGMSNAPAHTLAEALADGKHICGNCNPVSTELVGLPVLWLDENDLCHTSDECAAFSGQYSLVSRDDALGRELAGCPDCGAAEYLIPGTVLANAE